MSISVLGRCPTLARQLYRHGDFNVDNTSVCYVTKRLHSGRLVSTMVSSIHAASGSPLTSCLDVAVHLQQTLVRPSSTRFSMTRLLLFVLPLTTLLNRCSQLHRLAASSVYSLQSQRQMRFRWCERLLPDKQCSSDPLPPWLLKASAGLLAPFLCHLFNGSFEHGEVPSSMKAAYITPIVKKSDMDPREAKSYPPILNLSVLSKLLERLVSKQFVTYLKDNKLLKKLQSGFRAYHSMETAVLKVVGDILHALDTGNIALLTLSDFSAAFVSVDHSVLLQRLQKSYSLHGTVIAWSASYVRTPASKSTPSFVLYGVPQGSVLGPILFVLYVSDVL